MTNIIDNLSSNQISTAATSNTSANSIAPGSSSTTTNLITNHANGGSSSSSSNHETCLICGDVASGKHYGLRSCEACKAFFKRTVQGKIEYSCPATRECEINKRRRKACQACRFQKCLNMGMLKEGVRLDRVRGGRQKYRRGISPAPGSFATNNVNPMSNTLITGTGSTAGPSSNTGSVGRVNSPSSSLSKTATATHGNGSVHPLSGTSIATTHLQTSIGTGETNKIMTALINCEPEELSVGSTYITNIPANASVQSRTLNILSDLFDRELVSLIGWAKQIPGFTETITLNDQMRLLQSTWAEVIALSIGYRSHLKRIENYRQQQQQEQRQQHGNGHHHFMNATTPSPTSSSPASTTSSSYNTNSASNNSTIYSLESIDIRLVFAKDLIIDFKNAVTCGVEEIFYNCVQLIKRLDYLRITPKEYILLKAISLTNADVRLENPKATFRLRDLVMDALYEVTLTDCLNGNSVGLNEITSLNAMIKQEARSGLSNIGNYNNQTKIEVQERTPNSINQYASSSSSTTPPSRSSSSIPSSSSILSLSPHNNGSGVSNTSNMNVCSNNLDLGKKTIVNNRMNQVLLCLPVLRQIDTCIRKFWNDIRKGPNNVPMNKLFEEMLEPCQRMYRSSVEM